MRPRERGNGGNNGQGSKWIREEKRLAIYLRDGLSCVYCGVGIEDNENIRLSLDHLRPRSKGGSNHETNLVTCCGRCNSSRGARTFRDFAIAAASYIDGGRTPEVIVATIERNRKRKLTKYMVMAKAMIAERQVTVD